MYVSLKRFVILLVSFPLYINVVCLCGFRCVVSVLYYGYLFFSLVYFVTEYVFALLGN
jgi:hypothetical protein